MRWVVLGYLVAASFVLYLLRSNLSIAGEAMMSDLGIDKVQLSLVLGALSTTSILILLIGLRFLMGVTQAPFFPVTSGGTIGRWFPVAG